MIFAEECKKLFLLFRKDPKALAAGIIAPTLILLAYGLVFGGFGSLPITIINRDTGPLGEILQSEVLEQISPLGGKPYFQNIAHPYKKAEKELMQGNILALLEIPADFSRKLENSENPELLFYLYNYNSDFAKNLRLYLNEGILAFYKNSLSEWDISILEASKVPMTYEWVEIIASGTLLLAGAMGGMFSFLFYFFKDRDHGTLVFYTLSPRPVFGMLTARYLFSFCFGMLCVLVNITLALFITGRNFFIHLPAVFVIMVPTILFYISASSVFSLLMRKFYAAAMGSMFGAIIIWFISGGMNEAPINRETITGVMASLFPNIYALEILRAAVFLQEKIVLQCSLIFLYGLSLFSTAASYLFYRFFLWKGTCQRINSGILQDQQDTF